MASGQDPFATAHDGKKIPAMQTFGTVGELYSAVMVVGAEVPDVINVAIQLNDFFGNPLTTVASCFAYLSVCLYIG